MNHPSSYHNSLAGEKYHHKLLSLSLDLFFRSLFFQVTFLIFFSIYFFSVLFKVLLHCSNATWTRWRLRSPAYWLFVQQLLQTSNKKSKFRITGPLWPVTVDSPHKGPAMWKSFYPCRDIIMFIVFFRMWWCFSRSLRRDHVPWVPGIIPGRHAMRLLHLPTWRWTNLRQF